MASRGKLQGIFTPNIVPLDARGEIHEPELRLRDARGCDECDRSDREEQ
jgi:hypothetical protein